MLPDSGRYDEIERETRASTCTITLSLRLSREGETSKATQPKQLAGLFGYGMRCHEYDQETGELLVKSKTRGESAKVRKSAIVQDVYTGGSARLLSDCDGPRELCICIRDAIIGESLCPFRVKQYHNFHSRPYERI